MVSCLSLLLSAGQQWQEEEGAEVADEDDGVLQSHHVSVLATVAHEAAVGADVERVHQDVAQNSPHGTAHVHRGGQQGIRHTCQHTTPTRTYSHSVCHTED